jgi:hypothetical protein
MTSGHDPADQILTLSTGYGSCRDLNGWPVRLLYIFLAVLWVMACAHAPSFDLDRGPARGPEDIIGRINQNALLVRSLRADVRLKSDRIPQSRLARADLLFVPPDRYRIRLKTIFGATIAVFSVYEEQAQLYLPMSNRLYEGPLTVTQVRELVGIELSTGDLLEALSGISTLPPVSELSDYQIVQDEHLLIFPYDQGYREVMVAADGYRILRTQYRDAFGEVVLEKQFDQYHLVKGVVLPQWIRVSFPSRGEVLEAQFFHQDVNVPWKVEDFHLELPKGVERVRLGLEYR